jgi:hypothetical protein
MIRVKVQNSRGQNFSADFQSQELADVWISEQIAKKSWGLPDRWLSFTGEPKVGYTDTRQIESDGDVRVEYFYPCEYEIEVIDITQSYQAQKESEEAKAYLLSTDWYIIREMDSGVPCPSEIKQLRAQARLKVI